MSIVPLYRSALQVPHKSCGLNSIQVRTQFYNKYKHGPTRVSNPKPDYVRWIKDFFAGEGKEFAIKHAKRIIMRPYNNTHGPPVYEPNKIYKFEKFDSDERIKQWKPVADSDSKNGFSISTFSRSPSGCGNFKGILDNRIPDDGLTMRAGCAAVIGPRRQPEKLLESNPTWNWFEFNTVHLKFRGDGRRYYFLVNTGTYDDDLMGYDIYCYPLYTRGGPYWQEIAIPFNRLIFASKAFIQDSQYQLDKKSVKFVGFNLIDTHDGPFNLEIAYIGLSFTQRPSDDYDMYETYAYPHIRFRSIHPGCDPPE